MKKLGFELDLVLLVATMKTVLSSTQVHARIQVFLEHLFTGSNQKVSLATASEHLQKLYPWTVSSEFLKEIDDVEVLMSITNEKPIRETILKNWLLSVKLQYGYYVWVPSIAPSMKRIH